MNSQANSVIMGGSESAFPRCSDPSERLGKESPVPDKDSTRLSRSQYRKQWRQTPWGKKTEKARALAASYQRGGKLTPEPCEVCGDPETEKHHEDYDHPLDVRWLCHEHHRMVTAGEIKLAYREPQVFHRTDRKTSLAIGKIARSIIKGLTSEQLTKLQDGIRNNRRILIQESNGIFAKGNSNG